MNVRVGFRNGKSLVPTRSQTENGLTLDQVLKHQSASTLEKNLALEHVLFFKIFTMPIRFLSHRTIIDQCSWSVERSYCCTWLETSSARGPGMNTSVSEPHIHTIHN